MMPRTLSSSDGLVPVDLIHSGIDHLAAAQALFETNPSHYDSAGYLAHLGIELLLKGWILEIAGQFQAIHDLKKLYQALEIHGAPRLSESAAATLDLLNTYEELRHPNLSDPVEVSNEDLPRIISLRGEICRSMPSQIVKELVSQWRPRGVAKALSP